VKKSINVIAATMTVMTTTIHPMVTTSRQWWSVTDVAALRYVTCY
jgi:hypothetical protein